jgi:hypothetical protein
MEEKTLLIKVAEGVKLLQTKLRGYGFSNK